MFRASHTFAVSTLVFVGNLIFVSGCDQSPPQKTPRSVSVTPVEDRQREASDLPVEVTTRIRFESRTQQSGVDFDYRNGKEGENFTILESLGGGIGLLDFDSDGRLDLFIPGGGQVTRAQVVQGLPGAVYRQTSSWEFEECTQLAGVGQSGLYSHGAAVADFDSDGFSDLLVTGYGGLQLFHNQGDGTFREAAFEAGLTDDEWSSSASWGDIDNDGDLDLYVAHYVDWSFENNPHCPGPGKLEREICSPRVFQGLTDILYRSNGNGSFSDISGEMKIAPGGKGLGVLIADVDLNGLLDIYVCNDTQGNFLYRTQGTDPLEDVSISSGTALSERGIANGSMGVALGDFDLNGLPDIWVANYENESFALYRNKGDCFFQHNSQMAGVTRVGPVYVGWGTLFNDFDHDGDEDIFGSNGHVIRFPSSNHVDQRPLLFDNQAGNSLVNVASQVGGYFRHAHHGRGAAGGDIDNDGDIDLVISRVNQNVALLCNESSHPGNWLQVHLTGIKSSRTPIGATIRVQTESGLQIRQLTGGGSYGSTHDPRLHFGLGAAETVQKLEVAWPSGRIQQLTEIPVSQLIHLIEPES
jgi:hypothetical protein